MIARSLFLALTALCLVGLGPALLGCSSFHQGALPETPKAATFAEVAGARVHYVDRGTGPTVVLIHGFASSLGTWTPVLPVLAKEHRVIALDLKGFGLTDRPVGDYSPAAQAALVWALLEERGVEGPVAVVAHSWGSGVALHMALGKPDRVERIALYDAWVYEEQLPTFFLLARTPGIGEALIDAFYLERQDDKMATGFHDPRFVTEELVENVERQMARPGTRAAALAAIRGQSYREVEGRYRTIDKPVLLLWGREDRVTPLAIGERLLRELPNAKLVVYPGCGHFPMIEAEKPSTRELAAFLRPRVEAAGAKPLESPPQKPVGPSRPDADEDADEDEDDEAPADADASPGSATPKSPSPSVPTSPSGTPSDPAGTKLP